MSIYEILIKFDVSILYKIDVHGCLKNYIKEMLKNDGFNQVKVYKDETDDSDTSYDLIYKIIFEINDYDDAREFINNEHTIFYRCVPDKYHNDITINGYIFEMQNM